MTIFSTPTNFFFSAAQGTIDAQDQFAGAERLGDVIIGAELEADDLVNFLGFRGEHNDGDVARFGIALEDAAISSPGIFGSIKSRMISDGASLRALASRRRSIFNGHDLKSGRAEIHDQQIDDIGLIINHHDLMLHKGKIAVGFFFTGDS